jgi:hypothetical protein
VKKEIGDELVKNKQQKVKRYTREKHEVVLLSIYH